MTAGRLLADALMLAGKQNEFGSKSPPAALWAVIQLSSTEAVAG